MRSEVLFVIFGLILAASAKKGYGPTDQEWGYVTVREGAHLFWWLHYTTATETPTERPLIIWVQGGPGGSSTEFGNFGELGPIDYDGNPRNTTWVKDANVLFVDNPVGTGFSYVDRDQYATTNQQIADDYVALLQGFYAALPQFEDVPLYIFSESYGGKMTAEIALNLHEAIRTGKVKSNFKGVGLGDSWVSPVDSCLTWAPYLYQQGFLDTQQYEKLNGHAQELKALVDSGKWSEATDAWGTLEYYVEDFANDVDFYNILTVNLDFPFVTRKLIKPGRVHDEDDSLMNEKVKPALNLTHDWGAQADEVFSALYEDFMKPATDVVERLLNETDLTVAVYNGQLDLIVDTPGQISWVDRLQFKESKEWAASEKQPFAINGAYEGFEKKAGNLVFYWVLRAGHMVPRDNTNGMFYILKQVTNNFKV